MSIPLIRANRHLGDNLGIYLDVTYAGLVFELPMTVTWVDPAATEFVFYVDTQDVETWGGWAGHPVSLNGNEIGRVQDSNNGSGSQESTKIIVKKSNYPEPFKVGAKNRLTISVDKKDSSAGLLDDFILLGYSTDGFSAKSGW